MAIRNVHIAASIIATTALVLGLAAQPVQAEVCHGVTMPHSVGVAGKPLFLNGMGTREATVLKVNVYVAGLYLPAPSRDGAEILRRMTPMRISLQLLRNVDRGQMTSALREGLKRNAGARMASFEDRTARLEQMIPDLHDGDTIAFTYMPQAPHGWLVLQVNGRERGRIEGADFAQAFFGIWLAEPPNKDLKRGLLGGACK